MLFGLTIRAVLLDSGFVETNPVSKSLNANSNSNVERKWYIPTLCYTLPKIISSGKNETVMIRFQSVGSYCRIYGCLVGGTTVHSVLLDKDSLSLFSTVVWANCERVIVVMKATNTATKIQPKKEVLKYWKQIKDELVLPLLTDLCEIAGLETPPCFMGLPDELKFKILESVSAFDLARVSCVSSRLRCLASSDELWKRKYDEHFGEVVSVHNGGRTYKEIFVNTWDWEEYQTQCMWASYFYNYNMTQTLLRLGFCTHYERIGSPRHP
ncbi:putative F-box domain-containing protein [Helianthus annuus]|nr:putative F-box domain-containing protein [Helianthus annuus]